MRKKEAPESISIVRITFDAKAKLDTIAKRKNTTFSDAASRIIIHYAQNNLDYEVLYVDQLKSFAQILSNVNVTTSKIAGSAERTESFIKTLLRDDRPVATPDDPSQDDNDSNLPVAAESPNLTRALEIIRSLFADAKQAIGFDGNPQMQIRIPMADFNQLKIEYEEICTSQNM